MRSLRYLLVGLGLAVFGAAVFVVVTGNDAGLVEPLLAATGNDYVLVAAFGAAALAVTALALLVRGFRGLDQATPPKPEKVRTAPHPGVEFDRTVDDGVGLSLWLASDETGRVRERLREAAIRAVMRADGASRREAREAVETGAWTDDEVATAFLGSGGPSPGLSARLRAAARGESGFQYGARRTATAIYRTANGGEHR